MDIQRNLMLYPVFEREQISFRGFQITKREKSI